MNEREKDDWQWQHIDIPRVTWLN